MSRIRQLLTSTTLILVILLNGGCFREVALPVKAGFVVKAAEDNFSIPATLTITNQSEGADSYEWTFEGGTPSSSTERDPGKVLYTKAGSYKIVLVARNVDNQEAKSEQTIIIGDALVPSFTYQVVDNNLPPVTAKFKNTSQGSSKVEWVFEGGTPGTSTEIEPTVNFEAPGPHKVTLKAYFGTYFRQKDTTLVVGDALKPDFDYAFSPVDFDGEAPLTLNTLNKTMGGVEYTWKADGGKISSPSAKETSITFDKEGTYAIILEASNGKKKQQVTKTVTVKPNSNLYVHKNVKLGINTASREIGCFFSTKTGQIFKDTGELTEEEAQTIDVVFFGLNPSFTYNRFVSPTDAGRLTFEDIPKAQKVSFVNVMERCSSCKSFTSTDFDAMVDDSAFRTLQVPAPGETLGFNDAEVPRLVLFETQNGRKGLIRITKFVREGEASYIVVDVKAMKEKR
ncbi:PKD domain-containing protein [Telluribacter sp. SYSU D00476]|uniref:PKD domain-containing protein n=1 Tax=Telluribacter sp. SYSU D00476 TaxID=2811430 RepID=UPI001FF1003B|nr:hypothetical protein [Telluribacter sp. SYSU D00476]